MKQKYHILILTLDYVIWLQGGGAWLIVLGGNNSKGTEIILKINFPRRNRPNDNECFQCDLLVIKY